MRSTYTTVDEDNRGWTDLQCRELLFAPLFVLGKSYYRLVSFVVLPLVTARIPLLHLGHLCPARRWHGEELHMTLVCKISSTVPKPPFGAM